MFQHVYGRRFLLLGLAAFLANVFAAPSSQLSNRYLTNAHDFTNSDVALFRSVTLGLPGLIGILLAGRLAESRGRRPVTIIGLLVATGFQMAFFLTDGGRCSGSLRPSRSSPPRAVASRSPPSTPSSSPPRPAGRRTASCSSPASRDPRSASSLATQLRDTMGGLGPAIALCGAATIIAAIFVVPRLPETAASDLDAVSPTEGLPERE